MSLPRMLKITEVARIAGMHRNQVWLEIRAGRLRAKKTNSPRGEGKLAHYLVSETELKRYLDNLPDALEPAGASAPPKPGAAIAVEEPPVKKRRPSTRGGADWV